MFMYIYIYISVCVCVCLSMYIYRRMFMHVYIYIYIYIYMFMYVCVHICVCIYVCMNDLGIVKNYRGITLTSRAAKSYNALIRNRIEPKIDKILRKNQNDFRRNRSTTSQILTIRRIQEGVRAKNLKATILFVDFFKAFDSIQDGNK